MLVHHVFRSPFPFDSTPNFASEHSLYSVVTFPLLILSGPRQAELRASTTVPDCRRLEVHWDWCWEDTDLPETKQLRTAHLCHCKPEWLYEGQASFFPFLPLKSGHWYSRRRQVDKHCCFALAQDR